MIAYFEIWNPIWEKNIFEIFQIWFTLWHHKTFWYIWNTIAPFERRKWKWLNWSSPVGIMNLSVCLEGNPNKRWPLCKYHCCYYRLVDSMVMWHIEEFEHQCIEMCMLSLFTLWSTINDSICISICKASKETSNFVFVKQQSYFYFSCFFYSEIDSIFKDAY